MITSVIQIPASKLDIRLCVTCGQVFRWEVLPDGRLLGVDGENVFAVKQTENSIELMGDRDAFEKLFRFDEDFDS